MAHTPPGARPLLPVPQPSRLMGPVRRVAFCSRPQQAALACPSCVFPARPAWPAQPQQTLHLRVWAGSCSMMQTRRHAAQGLPLSGVLLPCLKVALACQTCISQSTNSGSPPLLPQAAQRDRDGELEGRPGPGAGQVWGGALAHHPRQPHARVRPPPAAGAQSSELALPDATSLRLCCSWQQALPCACAAHGPCCQRSDRDWEPCLALTRRRDWQARLAGMAWVQQLLRPQEGGGAI